MRSGTGTIFASDDLFVVMSPELAWLFITDVALFFKFEFLALILENCYFLLRSELFIKLNFYVRNGVFAFMMVFGYENGRPPFVFSTQRHILTGSSSKRSLFIVGTITTSDFFLLGDEKENFIFYI